MPPAPALAVPANNCTIALAWQSRLGQYNTPLIHATHSAGGKLAMLVQAGYLLESVGAQVNIPGFTVPQPGHLVAQCTLILTCTATQFECRLTINGVTQTSVFSSPAPTAGTLSAFQLGRWTNYANASMCVSQYVVTAQALSSIEQDALQAYLLSKPADDPPITAPLIAMLGDSVGAAWTPNYQTALNALANPPRVISAAVAGAGTTSPSQIPAYYVTDVLPHYSASRAKNIIVCEGISINDVGAGQSAAAVLSAYYSILDRAKADGWIVVACTLSPTAANPAYEATRAIINPDIRANYLAHAHYLADVGAAPGMSTPTDAANTTYFLDGTHVTNTGYLVWDTILVPVLQAALTASPSPPAQSFARANPFVRSQSVRRAT